MFYIPLYDTNRVVNDGIGWWEWEAIVSMQTTRQHFHRFDVGSSEIFPVNTILLIKTWYIQLQVRPNLSRYLRYKRYSLITMMTIATDRNICEVLKLWSFKNFFQRPRKLLITHVRSPAFHFESVSWPTTSSSSLIIQCRCGSQKAICHSSCRTSDVTLQKFIAFF